MIEQRIRKERISDILNKSVKRMKKEALRPIPKERIIAHRGVKSLCPENTFPAFQKARELGLSWIETDVTLLKDGSLILIHDDKLNRTTNGKGSVRDKTGRDILALDAGRWFSLDFSGTPVPGLKESLRWMSRHQMALNLEMKCPSDFPTREEKKKFLKQLVRGSLEEIGRSWTSPAPLILSSFSFDILKEAREILDQAAPDSPLCRAELAALHKKRPFRTDYEFLSRILREAKELRITRLHLCRKNLNRRIVRAVKNRGYELYTYTVNNPQKAQKFLEWGIDGFFTDTPQLFL